MRELSSLPVIILRTCNDDVTKRRSFRDAKNLRASEEQWRKGGPGGAHDRERHHFPPGGRGTRGREKGTASTWRQCEL